MKRAADEIEREEAQMTKRTSTRAWTKSAEEVERYDGVVRERERERESELRSKKFPEQMKRRG